MPTIDFDDASRQWRANKFSPSASASTGLRYYREKGDDVFVNMGMRWCRGVITAVHAHSVDVSTDRGNVRGVHDDMRQVQDASSTEFVERKDGYCDHRPARRTETRQLLGFCTARRL